MVQSQPMEWNQLDYAKRELPCGFQFHCITNKLKLITVESNSLINFASTLLLDIYKQLYHNKYTFRLLYTKRHSI